MTGPGDELAELLWDHGGPALRRPPPPPFQPFTCSAAGSSSAHELRRHAKAAAAPSFPLGLGGMHDAGAPGLGLAGLPPIQDDDDDADAVPWLHCPVVDDGDADTAPLPPEYFAGLLPEYPGPAPPEAAADKMSAPPTVAGAGEPVMNFTFFSRPLQRQQASAAASNPVESTVVQAATTNRLRGTPLFSEQRMAWLQPPKAPPPPPPPPPQAPQLPDNRREQAVATVAQTQPRSQQPEARPPDAAAGTTSSVCSGNGDRSLLKRCSHLPTDCSVSAGEDLDDEGGATRRSAARSAKRSRTAEVHNLSERRRRDRINEKMRALQELIPNCNKIDKASMLEEAIEYLKTLQLQVQMMSMGTGLCVPPPMLLPAAMHQHHHLQAAAAAALMAPHHHHHPMAHFPPHLGMGLGFGMGAAAAFDMRVAAGAHWMPPGPMFGVPSPALFAHLPGGAAAPAENTEPAGGAPARRDGAEHPPAPVATLAQGEQKAQHPKQT